MNEMPALVETCNFWDLATGNIKERIFRNLNFTDLKNCRRVTKSWNVFVTKSTSFKTGVFYISLGPNSQTVVEATLVHWNHIRFALFDVANCPDILLNQSLTKNIFSRLQVLEFKQCFISWQLFRKFIGLAPFLQTLIFHRSIFKDAEHLPTSAAQPITFSSKEQDDFLLRIQNLQAIIVTESGELTGILEILERMLLYSPCSLVTLKIEYKTSQHIGSSDAERFLRVLTELILLNKLSLRNLVLNIRNTEILNHFLPLVLMPMEPFARVFQLRVFKLAQPIPDSENPSITVESNRFLFHFGDFLRTQRNLQSLAFPNLVNMGAAEGRRWSILDNTTKHLEKLRVPGSMYLRRNMLKSFHSLKVLFIGEKHLGNSATFLHPTKFNMDKSGLARRNSAKMHTLCIYAPIIYESGNLFHVLEKFPNLTIFELNCLRPLFNDKDVQALMKHAPQLTHLSISYCDLITDAGLTGIPLGTCQDMLRYSTLYIEDIKVTKKLGIAGSPLSDLKSLLSLQLIGTAQVTDVGIKFGLEFQDLRKIHLPFCKRITSWGIEQLGVQNKCLESITLSGATEETAIGLAKVIASHNRLVKDQCIVQTIKKLDGEMIHPTLLHGIIWNNSNPT